MKQSLETIARYVEYETSRRDIQSTRSFLVLFKSTFGMLFHAVHVEFCRQILSFLTKYCLQVITHILLPKLLLLRELDFFFHLSPVYRCLYVHVLQAHIGFHNTVPSTAWQRITKHGWCLCLCVNYWRENMFTIYWFLLHFHVMLLFFIMLSGVCRTPVHAEPKFGNNFGEFVRHRKDVTKNDVTFMTSHTWRQLFGDGIILWIIFLF